MSAIPYRTDDDPPYPALELVLSNAGYERRCHGKVDTGASVTCVPQRFLNELNAVAANEVVIVGFDGRDQVTSTYHVCLQVADANWPDGVPSRFEDIEVCAIDEPADAGTVEVLIGRDVLAAWSLLLEGPHEVLHVKG